MNVFKYISIAGIFIALCFSLSVKAQTFHGYDQGGEPCSLTILKVREDVKAVKPHFEYHYMYSQYMTVQVNYVDHEIAIGPEITHNEEPGATCHWKANFNMLKGHIEEDVLYGSIISGVIEHFEVTYEPNLNMFTFEKYAYDETKGEDEKMFLGYQTCRFREHLNK